MNYHSLTILTAYLLDLVIGDPQWQWHPVRFIGRLIAYLESRLNTDKFNKRLSGIVLIMVVVGLTVFCVWGALKLVNFYHSIFYYLLLILFIYFGLSIKALAVEAAGVRSALLRKDIEEARKKLSLIVGRDTERLDEPQIIRATVETVAESTMDGVIAPLFYCFLGGPVLMWAYKAVNTLDSMVGYQNGRFKEFGWASAKLDGLINFIPGRITCILIGLSCLFGRGYLFNSIKWGGKYFFKGLQDNSRLTEAAMAGAIGVQLGGVNFYNRLVRRNPLIGDRIRPLVPDHILMALKISYVVSVLMLLSGLGLIGILQ